MDKRYKHLGSEERGVILAEHRQETWRNSERKRGAIEARHVVPGQGAHNLSAGFRFGSFLITDAKSVSL